MEGREAQGGLGPRVWAPRRVWAPGLCGPFITNKCGSPGDPAPAWPTASLQGVQLPGPAARQAGCHAQGPAVRVTAGRALGLHEPAGPGPSPGPSLPLPWPNARLHPGPEARSSQKHSVLLQVPRPVGSAQ